MTDKGWRKLARTFKLHKTDKYIKMLDKDALETAAEKAWKRMPNSRKIEV
jgi:hypothetical protein